MRFKKYLSLTIVLVLILTALTGCGKKDAVNDTGTQESEGQVVEKPLDSEQYLNLVMVAEPSTLDASKGSDSYSNGILNEVLEPLTRLEEDEDLKNVLRPAGASEWTHNEDGTVWTFKIRDAKWSDGVAVRAQDYEYGIKRSLAQDTAAPYAYLLAPIKNAAEVNSGQLPLEELGVKSLDDNTLEITLESPTPYFLQLTYQRVMMPQRQDVVEKHKDKYGSEIDTLVYNGPFTITNWVHNSEIVLTKNDNYWDKDIVKLNSVNIKILNDENAIYNSLSNRSIDSSGVGKPEWIEKFKGNKDLNHIEVTNPQTFFKFFNTKDKVFSNANVRKAFALAIDREELANVIFHGINVPAYGWVSPNISIGDEEFRSVSEEPIRKLAADNPNPKALLIKGLEELGMDTDPSKLTVKMTLGSTDQWFRTYGEYVQQMYNKNLGVKFEVEFVEWPVFTSMAEKGEFQIGYMAWGAEFNDPISLLSLLKSDAGSIQTGWSNERYDELIDLASKEMDPKKRLEYFAEAEKILLYDEAVLAPTVYPKSNVFRYKYVQNLGVTPFGTAGYKYGFTQGR